MESRGCVQWKNEMHPADKKGERGTNRRRAPVAVRMPGSAPYALRDVCEALLSRLRGAEADRDEAFCREQAGKLGVRFACLHTDVKALAQQEGVSVEVCGREVRYRFFESLLEEGEAPSGEPL